MKTESCRERREVLGAYALGHLTAEERAGFEAHLEGCPGCRAEAESLVGIARLLPHADPERFGNAPGAVGVDHHLCLPGGSFDGRADFLDSDLM